MGLDVRYDDRGCEGVLVREVRERRASSLPVALLAGIPLLVAAAVLLTDSPEIGAGIAMGTALLLAFGPQRPRLQRQAVPSPRDGVRVVRERFTVRDGHLTLTTAHQVHTLDLAGATIARRPDGILVQPASGLPVLLGWEDPKPSELQALENALTSAARHATETRGAPEDVPRALTKLTE